MERSEEGCFEQVVHTNGTEETSRSDFGSVVAMSITCVQPQDCKSPVSRSSSIFFSI